MDRKEFFLVLYVFESVVVLVSAIPTSQNDWDRCKLSEERPHICPESKACCSFTEYCAHGHCESCFTGIENVLSWCMENQSIDQFPHPACRYACNDFLRSTNDVQISTTPAENTTLNSQYKLPRSEKGENNYDSKNNFQISTTPAVNTTLNAQYQQLRSEKVENHSDTKNKDSVLIIVKIILIIVVIILIIVVIQPTSLAFYFIQRRLRNRNVQVNQEMGNLMRRDEQQIGSSSGGNNVDIEVSVQPNEEQQRPSSGGQNNDSTENSVQANEVHSGVGNNNSTEESIQPVEEQQRPSSNVANNDGTEDSVQPNEGQQRPLNGGGNDDRIEDSALRSEEQQRSISGGVNNNVIEDSVQPNEEQQRPSNDGRYEDGIENTELHGEAQLNPSSGIEYDGASGTTNFPAQTGSSSVKYSVSWKNTSFRTSLSEHASKGSNELPKMYDYINTDCDDNDDDDDRQQNATNPLLGPESEVFPKQNNYKKNLKRETLYSVNLFENKRAFQERGTIPLFGPTLYKKVIDLQDSKKEKNRSKVKRTLSL